jgi:hypothetical protein
MADSGFESARHASHISPASDNTTLDSLKRALWLEVEPSLNASELSQVKSYAGFLGTLESRYRFRVCVCVARFNRTDATTLWFGGQGIQLGLWNPIGSAFSDRLGRPGGLAAVRRNRSGLPDVQSEPWRGDSQAF